MPRKTILVIGEVGDGKSTLIERLRDHTRSPEGPEIGLCARGVTKNIMRYAGPRLADGTEVDFIDTPGVGDHDVNYMQLVALIEQALTTPALTGGIDGVLVTTSVTDCRVKLGAQVVQALVDKGFVGEQRWASVILVGTKSDRAEAAEIANFRTQVVPLFFAAAPAEPRLSAIVNQRDYTALLQVLQQLPGWQVQYEPPPPEVMGRALAAKLGIDSDLFQAELARVRDLLREQARDLERVQDELRRRDEQHRQEMQQFVQQLQTTQQQLDRAARDAAEARRQEANAAAEAARSMQRASEEAARREERMMAEMQRQRAAAAAEAAAAELRLRQQAEDFERQMRQRDVDHQRTMAELRSAAASRKEGDGSGGVGGLVGLLGHVATLASVAVPAFRAIRGLV